MDSINDDKIFVPLFQIILHIKIHVYCGNMDSGNFMLDYQVQYSLKRTLFEGYL